MRDGVKWETLTEVLKGARAAGWPVTRAQLHRWQRASLIPAPIRRGRGRGLGTETLYPPGTTDRAVVVGHYLKENRNVAAVLLRLFWNKYCVPEEKIRNLLNIELQLLRRDVEDVFSGRNPEGKTRLLKKIHTRSNDPIIENWSKVLGQNDFEILLGYAAQLAAGRFKGFAFTYDKNVVAAAHGLSAEEVNSFFGVAADLFNLKNIEKTFQGASWSDILKTREELKAVFDKLSELVEVFEKSLRLGLIADRIKKKEWPLTMYLLATLVWLHLRKRPEFESIWNLFFGPTAISATPLDGSHGNQAPSE